MHTYGRGGDEKKEPYSAQNCKLVVNFVRYFDRIIRAQMRSLFFLLFPAGHALSIER